MRKYRPALTVNEKEELNELSKKNFSNWNETEVRESFVIPLLKLLGYKKDHDYDVSSERSIQLNPLFQQIGSSSSRLDYICSVRKSKFWIIEAKRGYASKGKKSNIGRKEVAQAYFYSLLPEINCPYFVVTNGWNINLYKRDEIDEELIPKLIIPHTSLPDAFLELDSYIGSSQIIPHLKQNILDDIKNVLSAEVYLDRLDEFNEKVKETIDGIRPNVMNNFRINAGIQEKRGNEDFKILINKVPLNLLPLTVFNYVSTLGQMETLSNIVLEKFNKSTPIERKMFLYNALLEEPRPVTIDYYFSLLKFLIKLYKSDPNCKGTVTGNTFEDILFEWIELLLFGFGERPILRYLWAFEGLMHRLTIRSLISPETRKSIDSVIKTDIYVLPEENIAWNSPNHASELIRIIEANTLLMSSNIIRKFYNGLEFKEVSCYQAFRKLKEEIEEVEKITEEEYWKLKKELGYTWGTLRSYEFTNHFKDLLFSGVCQILKSEPDILKILSPSLMKRIEIISSIRVDYDSFKNARIVTACEDCSKIIGVDVKEVKISKEEAERYFDPNEDPYEFTI